MAKAKNTQSGESLTNSLINAANSQGEAKETPNQEPAKQEEVVKEDPDPLQDGSVERIEENRIAFQTERADAAEKRIDMLENMIAEKDEEISELKKDNEMLLGQRNEAAILVESLLKNQSEKAPEAIPAKSEPGLEELYGKGFVRAQKGGSEKIFTRATWNLLGKDKGGWLPVVETPPEAQGL